MPINIQANVIDIRRDTPRPSDVFFVDSNVWFWVGYSNATVNIQHNYNQGIDYPSYLKRALAAGAKLHKCTLSFSEIAHSIERHEWEIFQALPGNSSLKLKDYRHNYPTERQNVIAEITNTWVIADSMTQGASIAVNVDNTALATAMSQIATLELDGYDLFMLEAVRSAGMPQIITDDSDFGQVPGIQVFTANGLLLPAANAQGKLIRR